MQGKMNVSADRFRVVIAVTESSSLSALWHAAVNLVRESPAEFVALFVHGDRWRRAASLPFTREISRASGSAADFTVQRAEKLTKDAIARTQRRIENLAIEADLALAFEALPESDQCGILERIGTDLAVLVMPSAMTRLPIYSQLRRLNCRIVLIEENEN